MSNDAKRRAARGALQLLPQTGVVGLGSGSTANCFIEELGQLVASGRQYRAVATSVASRRLAESVGIEVLDDAGPWDIAVNVDGADEVSQQLDLIKGGGACHAREKIVNDAAKLNVVIVDASKLSARLGERFAVPIEVLRFGHRATGRRLASFGSAARREAEGPVVTDAGNYIYDVRTGPIDDPAALDRALLQIPGVVETGLFVQRADVVLVADEQGLRTLRRDASG